MHREASGAGDFNATSSADSPSPSLLGRATTRSSTRSQRALRKIKTAGSRLKVWKRGPRRRGQDGDEHGEETRHEKRSWQRQALEYMVSFDSPNPYLGVVWLY